MKVLLVDDEPEIREELAECLLAEGYECLCAANAEEALKLIRHDARISIVLLDIQMPGRSGLEMLAELAAERQEDSGEEGVGQPRELETIVMTGHGGTKEAIKALQLGVLDFLPKPISIDYLMHTVHKAEELILLKRAKKHYHEGLKADVQAKTLEIRKLLTSLESAYAEALDCLAVAAEFKDPETGSHIRRIGEYAKVMAKELGWSSEKQRMIHLAAPLHDAGKIGTPETVLLKPGALDADEVVIMKNHAELGYQILSRSNHPTMIMAANIARGHHERWNGGGYPRQLKGSEIPIEARITTLADVYDALRSKRCYKPAFDHDKTLVIMLEGDGRTEPDHFDPELLAVFKRKSNEFSAIFENMVD